MDHQARVRSRGRPRAFDEPAFLDGAIALFSVSGFCGVGISDLTETTGLTVGSVYKAYRDKEGVFVKALERYIALREAQIARIFEKAGNARLKLEALVSLYFGLSRGEDGKLGCLVVSGITDVEHVGRAADVLRIQLVRRQAMLTQLIEEGRSDGSIAAGEDSRTLATVLLALFQGMRVVGKAGGLPGEADAFVAVTLKALC